VASYHRLETRLDAGSAQHISLPLSLLDFSVSSLLLCKRSTNNGINASYSAWSSEVLAIFPKLVIVGVSHRGIVLREQGADIPLPDSTFVVEDARMCVLLDAGFLWRNVEIPIDDAFLAVPLFEPFVGLLKVSTIKPTS